jgi:hypothetical protein
MPRRFRSARRRRPVRVARFSNETNHQYHHLVVPQRQTPVFQALVVAGTAIQGVRKVKNITIRFITTQLQCPLISTVVYIPEGTVTENLTLAVGSLANPTSLYEPAQNVIMYGQFVSNASAPQSFHTRLARNLQSNDHIRLLMRPIVQLEEEWTAAVDIVTNFAIC